jgi:hypothetical protein
MSELNLDKIYKNLLYLFADKLIYIGINNSIHEIK